MGLKIRDLEARRKKRLKWSRDAVRAKERLRLERQAEQKERLEREFQEAEGWVCPKLRRLPEARITIDLPGLPKKVIKLTKFSKHEVFAMGRITTAKQFGRRLGVLIDQFFEGL